MALAGTVKFTRDGAVEFAKTHPVAPLHQPNLGLPSVARAKPGDRHTMRSNQRIYSATLNKKSTPSDSANLSYTLDLQDYTAGTAVPAGSFLCWYLPWNPEGGMTNMTLSTTAVADDRGANVNPPLFFTAQLSGCSVFVRGTAQKPEVFHAGSAAKRNWEGSSATHWRMNFFAAARPKTFAQGSFVEVSRNNYVGPYTPTGQRLNTDVVDNYIAQTQALEANFGRPFQLIDFMGVACVFGVRDANGDWSFYLQENIRVGYSRHTTGLPVLQWANRVLRLSQVFPTKVMLFTNMVPKPLP
jgi:hypothetical protein